MAISSVITHVLGRPLKGLLAEQQHREASFRYSMARWRTAFDEVALSNGEAAETRVFRSRFDAVADNWRRVIRAELVLGSFTFPFRHSVLRIPLFVALPGYLAGHVAFGGLMQLSMAFSNVVTTLSWFIFSYRDLAELVATASRLDHFMQAAEEHGNHRPVIARVPSKTGAVLGPLAVSTPDGRPLVALPEVALKPGEMVWLRGPSGIGKTTLVKAVAGLWRHGTGKVSLPSEGAMYLPQKPYLPTGSVMEAAAYPSEVADFDADKVKATLRDVGLGHHTQTLPGHGDQAVTGLSGGELQRLALARLLLHRPRLALLDEATSALDQQAETTLLALIRERLPETTLFIIAHRLPNAMTTQRIIDLDASGLPLAATA